MLRRLFNQTTYTGYGSIILSIVQFFEDGTEMSVTMWVLIVIGVSLILFGALKTPPKERLKRSQVNELYKERGKYLPKLKELFGKYNLAVANIADKPKYSDIETYSEYNTNIFFPVFYIMNNVVFLREQNQVLANLRNDISMYSSMAKDKRVIKFANGIEKACHINYSYIIYTKICEKTFSANSPTIIKIWLWLARKKTQKFNKLFNKINKTIDDLVEVLDDEV